MDVSPRRSGGDWSGGRTSRRAGPAMRLAAKLLLAASLAAILPQAAAAQSIPAAKPPPKPAAKLPATTQAAPPADGPELDLAFGAFQRGYFLTAFQLATEHATDQGDAKSMTLLGELYANGLGVPRDDAKAA